MLKSSEDQFLPRIVFKLFLAILILPLLLIIVFSFLQYDALDRSFHLTLDGYREIFSAVRLKEISVVLLRSMLVSMLASVISFLLSYFLYLESNRQYLSIYLLLITLPFLVNEAVRVFSWQSILAEYGVANSILSIFSGTNIFLFNSTNSWNVLIVMIISLIPFGVFINTLTLAQINKDMIWAARDLGANEINVFRKVIFPLGLRGIFFSFVVCFFFSLAMSQEVAFLGGDTKQSLRILISDLLSANKLTSVFSIGSILLLIASGGLLSIYSSSNNKKQ